MAKKDERLPVGVTKIGKATGTRAQRGESWCYLIDIMVHGERFKKRVNAATTITELNDLIRKRKGTMDGETAPEPTKGTIEADIKHEYLPMIGHMPSIEGRTVDIVRWGEYFTGRDRNSIKTNEIAKKVSEWAQGIGTDWVRWNPGKTKSRVQKGGKLSPSSLNHRISALSDFYTKVNGEHGYNPCDRIVRFVPPERAINFMEWPWVQKVADALEGYDALRPVVLRCLIWTGARPEQINVLRRTDLVHINAKPGMVIVRSGKGGRTNYIQLPKKGVQAFKDLLACEARGDFKFQDERPKDEDAFTTNSLRYWVKKVCKAVKYPHKFTAYWFRHSLATQMLETGASTRDVQTQLTHSSLDLVELYGKVTRARLATSMKKIK